MDGVLQAYATNLSFTDDVAHAAVGGIGSYSYDSLEPLQYLARGSFSLMRYSQSVNDANLLDPSSKPATLPGRMNAKSPSDHDGNSLLRASSFNPVNLMLSRSFDIVVYERQKQDLGSVGDMKEIYKMNDCRMTSYGITFSPGALISENIGFICITATDSVAQA